MNETDMRITQMKIIYKKLYKLAIVLLIGALPMILSCSSVNDNSSNNLTEHFHKSIDSVLASPLSLKNVPEDKVLIIGRLLFYMEGEPRIRSKEVVELGFVPVKNFLDINERKQYTTFYPLKRDKQGYFFLLLDTEPIVLSYIYIKNDSKIYSLSGSAVLNLNDDIESAYCGEIHIVKGLNRNHNTPNEHTLDTTIQLYDNYTDGIDYLDTTYHRELSGDIENIRYLPFISP